MLSRRRAAAMASPSFVWALSRTRNASNSAWKVLRSTILGAPTSSFMKSFIVLSGSHLAAPALDPMPMLQIVGRREAEKSDHRHPCLLRARRQRPRRRRAAEKRYEGAAPDHSITSSARPSSVSGTVRPSDLAVFKL